MKMDTHILKPFIILIFCGTINCSLGQSAEEVLRVVKSVADKTIRETSFDLEVKELPDLKGWSQLYVPASNAGQDYVGYGKIQAAANLFEEDIFLGISYKGNVEIYLNGNKVHEGFSRSFTFSEYAYGMYAMQEKLPLDLKMGQIEIIVHIKGDDQNASVFFLPITEEGRLIEGVKHVSLVSSPSESKWLLAGPYNQSSVNVELTRLLSSSDDVAASLRTNSPWYSPASPLVKELVIPEENSFQRDAYADWHYATGGTMLGIINIFEATSESKYFDFVERFAANIKEKEPYFRWQYEEVGHVSGSYHRLFRLTMLDDSGGPAIPFAHLEMMNSNGDYTDILERVLKYVSFGQDRLADQTFCRPEPEDRTIWADDLFMSVPFLCRMAAVNKDSKLYDDVANQIINFSKYLRDDSTGLYFHGWYAERDEPSFARWSRANGWVTWAMTEALMLMPKSHPEYSQVQSIYQDHITSLAKFQNSNGMWHQVLDRPETYEETSSTAMFTLSLARGVNNGWLNKRYKDQAILGWKAIATKVETDGTVKGICRGTGIGESIAFYNGRQTFDHDPRGLGAVLTAGSEMSKLLKD